MIKATFRNPKNSVDAEVRYFKTLEEAAECEISGKRLSAVIEVPNVPCDYYAYEAARECIFRD